MKYRRGLINLLSGSTRDSRCTADAHVDGRYDIAVNGLNGLDNGTARSSQHEDSIPRLQATKHQRSLSIISIISIERA